jgi:formate-dependent nitrite reductase membrane component NrfD
MTGQERGHTDRRARRPGRRRGERAMVPEAEFSSYYGRPVVKASPWEADIPAYLFLGGLAGASSLLAAGADLTGNAALRRPARITALAAILASFAALVHDLGRPSRFHHMLRVAKVTSPMSVGTWILTAYAPMVGVAAVAEAQHLLPNGLAGTMIGRLLPRLGRAAGFAAALLGPAVASYTAVLLADTATPSWHGARDDLPFVFVGSAAAAAAGMGLLAVPVGQAGAARRMAVAGSVLELAMTARMESAMGLLAEPLHQGRAGRYLSSARVLTATGGLLAATCAGRSRALSLVSGAALLAGSAATRFGIFHAGQQSARDPRYTVVPQRQRLDQRRSP